MKAKGITEAALYVDNLEEAREFYAQVLGLEPLSEEEGRHVFFRCGDAVLLLFDPRTTEGSKGESSSSMAPPHGSYGAGHVAFPMNEDEIESWRTHLESSGVEIESEVEWAQGGYSIYFRDPDGNCLELVTPSIWGI